MECPFQEHEIMGYMDGALSLEEMKRLWRPLSHENRKHLVQEIQFEEALGQHLLKDFRCPDALWTTIKAALVV